MNTLSRTFRRLTKSCRTFWRLGSPRLDLDPKRLQRELKVCNERIDAVEQKVDRVLRDLEQANLAVKTEIDRLPTMLQELQSPERGSSIFSSGKPLEGPSSRGESKHGVSSTEWIVLTRLESVEASVDDLMSIVNSYQKGR